jgi:hypothetical protein
LLLRKPQRSIELEIPKKNTLGQKKSGSPLYPIQNQIIKQWLWKVHSKNSKRKRISRLRGINPAII